MSYIFAGLCLLGLVTLGYTMYISLLHVCVLKTNHIFEKFNYDSVYHNTVNYIRLVKMRNVIYFVNKYEEKAKDILDFYEQRAKHAILFKNVWKINCVKLRNILYNIKNEPIFHFYSYEDKNKVQLSYNDLLRIATNNGLN